MEEEKLLFPIKKLVCALCLIILLLSNARTYASNLDNDEITRLIDNKVNKQLFIKKEEVNFYMFASLSLSDNILKQMLEYAELYNGVVVLRGIEDNSFVKTTNHILRIAREESKAAIIIDPTLFKKYKVVQVPAYVLAKIENCPAGMSCHPYFDKISGNITPKFALEKILEKGDLKNEAQTLLGSNK